MPVDPFSASVLPLLDDELDPLNNKWDSDHGQHAVIVEDEGESR